MNSKRIYNRVMDDCSRVCPLGELLTDKELERMRLHNSRRDWPNTAKVTVKTGEIYFSFGVRFAESYELTKTRRMNSKRTYVATFWRDNPQLKNGGYYMTEEFQAVSHKAAEKQAEIYAKGMVYGGLYLVSVELIKPGEQIDEYAAQIEAK